MRARVRVSVNVSISYNDRQTTNNQKQAKITTIGKISIDPNNSLHRVNFNMSCNVAVQRLLKSSKICQPYMINDDAIQPILPDLALTSSDTVDNLCDSFAVAMFRETQREVDILRPTGSNTWPIRLYWASNILLQAGTPDFACADIAVSILTARRYNSVICCEQSQRCRRMKFLGNKTQGDRPQRLTTHRNRYKTHRRYVRIV